MRKPRLAIIGSGISGLTAAYFLQRDYEITLFERDQRIGGHTNTRLVDMRRYRDRRPEDGEGPAGDTLPVDTGFIVYNDRTYPNFIRMLRLLGVDSQPTEMSFSVSCERTGIEYSGCNLNTYFAQRRNVFRPSFYRFLWDFQRFRRQAMEALESPEEQLSVGEFFQRHRYSNAFYRRYFLPMGAAIWSCPPGVFSGFPFRFIAQFYHHHGLLTLGNRPQWRVIRGGSRSYHPPLCRGFEDRIETGIEIQAVRKVGSEGSAGGGAESESTLGNAASQLDGRSTGERWMVMGRRLADDGSPRDVMRRYFDHVILACHSNQALAILDPPPGSLARQLLQAFPYQGNLATLHTDSRVLPKNRRAWAAWNYHLPADVDDGQRRDGSGSRGGSEGAGAAATVTYYMNRLQGFDAQQTAGQVFCVTLNDDRRIDPSQVIEQFHYTHPVFSVGRLEAQSSHGDWIDRDGLSLCGAYWGNGFHEDGVHSALEVCQRLLGRDPWTVVSTPAGSNTAASTREDIDSVSVCS